MFFTDSPPFLLARESEELGKSRLKPGNREIEKKACNFGFETGRKIKFCVVTCQLLIVLET